MQDNDPKHTSIHVQEWMANNNINWWRTPAESPDMNPIENLWHEMEYIRREVKPRTKDELVQGIKDFWNTVHVQKCTKYIRHLRKVLPKVIELEGAATVSMSTYCFRMLFSIVYYVKVNCTQELISCCI